MKQKKYLLFVAIFALVGCDRSDMMPSFNKNVKGDETYTGERITLSFTATQGSLRGLPIEDHSIVNDDEKKNPGDKKKSSVKIKWDKGQTYPIKCVLYNANNPNQTSYFDVIGKITKVDDNTKHATIEFKGSLTLKEGTLAGGDWYIQLFMGLDEKYWDGKNHTYNIPRNIMCTVDEMKIPIPIASPWTKLNANVAGKHVSAYGIELNPLGSIVSLDIETPLCESMTFRKINLRTGLFRSTGSFLLGQFPGVDNIENSYPVFDPIISSSRDNASTSSYDLNQDVPENMKSGKPQTLKRLYFWAMMNEGTFSSDIIGKIYTANPDDDSEYEDIGMPMHSIQYISKNSPIRNGVSHALKMRLEESDLIITEMFHYNQSGDNCSMIELYNPTCHNIDLKNYSLVRMRQLFTTSENTEGWNAEGGFHPSDDNRDITKAVKQDIFIDSDKTTTVGGMYAENVWKDWGSAENRYKYISDIDDYAQKYNSLLPPGQTVILCARWIYEKYSTTDRSLKYPITDWVGTYIEKALKSRNKIHYIIAVNNGPKDIWGSSKYQHKETSGTLQHGRKHVMVLMKGQKPIDVTGPFAYRGANGVLPDEYRNFSSVDIYNNYISFVDIDKGAMKGGDDRCNLIRRPWSRYPSIHWDNNTVSIGTKFTQKVDAWDRKSRWIFVSGSGSGGCSVASLGTRNPVKEWLDQGYDYTNPDLHYVYNGTLKE